ncbi:GNAT family N-acetyltransferase [Oryzifoliimicrobium ureilyticus]|uniref:GNAT family N-acetyltransferase n=1 Tax=Oryzifoliimicrobium ureilyticus TaxID=3113724 RepID=UPI00307685F8
MNFTVRPAERRDALAVQSLYGHLNPRDPVHDDEAVLRNLDKLLLHPGLTVFLGFADSQLSSTATLVVVPNMTRNGAPYALIENVVTHPDHRGRGYGRRVIIQAIDTAWAAGCYKAMLLSGHTNLAAHRFYEACGFLRNKIGFQIRRADALER